MPIENAIIITSETRVEQLKQKFNTKAQAKFYIERSGSKYEEYEEEDSQFRRSLDRIINVISSKLKYKLVERKYVTNFLFSENDLIVVVGQDGLVANTAKYVNELPILAINPDVERYDGILLPFQTDNFEIGLNSILEDKATFKKVTMAEANMNDGQKLLAFNDFFIGQASHISARYKISFMNNTENQSSSGIIVSTGAGSTGWLSSLFNMANGIYNAFNQNENSNAKLKLQSEENKLVFIVREPFKSKHSQTNIAAGIITNETKLRIESFMPANGVIFSDGIEADFMSFNSGRIVEIGVSKQKAIIINNPANKVQNKKNFSKKK